MSLQPGIKSATIEPAPDDARILAVGFVALMIVVFIFALSVGAVFLVNTLLF